MPSCVMADRKPMDEFNVDDYILKIEKDLQAQLPDHPDLQKVVDFKVQPSRKRPLTAVDKSHSASSDSKPILKSRHKISYVGNGLDTNGGDQLGGAKLSNQQQIQIQLQQISNSKAKIQNSTTSIDHRLKSAIPEKKTQTACPLFLAGTCFYSQENCNMLHTLEPPFMPHCYHYLNYLCNRQNCPYLHINLGQNVGYCKTFIEKGSCHKAGDCSQYHVPVCETFKKYQVCNKGSCFGYHPGRVVEPKCYNRGSKQFGADSLKKMRDAYSGSKSPYNAKSELYKLEKSILSGVEKFDFSSLKNHGDFNDRNGFANSDSEESNKSGVPESPTGSSNQPYFGGPETCHDNEMRKVAIKQKKREMKMKSRNFSKASGNGSSSSHQSHHHQHQAITHQSQYSNYPYQHQQQNQHQHQRHNHPQANVINHVNNYPHHGSYYKHSSSQAGSSKSSKPWQSNEPQRKVADVDEEYIGL